MTDTSKLIERLRPSTYIADPYAVMAQAANAIEAKDAEIAELREALKPFINELRYERDNNREIDALENDQEITITVLLGDLRHARDICRARAKLEGGSDD